MAGSTGRGWRDFILIGLVVVGWAGFVGTVIGQLSINDQMARAKARAEEAEALLVKLQQQDNDMYAKSQQLAKEHENLNKYLNDKIARLEQRHRKYEPD